VTGVQTCALPIYLGCEIEFKGTGIDEKGYITACSNGDYKHLTGKCTVEVDKRYFRPSEVELLIGDPSKAKKKLGWEPQYDLKMLVDDMMSSDIKLKKKEKYLQEGGYQTFNYFE
jgi:GDPmannose 4,6-dehydratase